VAGAAICGILMNLILSIGEKKRLAAAASADEEDETVSE
jgi:hypothetical protein